MKFTRRTALAASAATAATAAIAGCSSSSGGGDGGSGGLLCEHVRELDFGGGEVAAVARVGDGDGGE